MRHRNYTSSREIFGEQFLSYPIKKVASWDRVQEESELDYSLNFYDFCFVDYSR